MSELPAASALKDPKTPLQEALQARGFALPVYTLTAVDGEAHAQSFTVNCEVAAFGSAAWARAAAAAAPSSWRPRDCWTAARRDPRQGPMSAPP
jgi:dsRNA-specific ribonuclease